MSLEARRQARLRVSLTEQSELVSIAGEPLARVPELVAAPRRPHPKPCKTRYACPNSSANAAIETKRSSIAVKRRNTCNGTEFSTDVNGNAKSPSQLARHALERSALPGSGTQPRAIREMCC